MVREQARIPQWRGAPGAIGSEGGSTPSIHILLKLVPSLRLPVLGKPAVQRLCQPAGPTPAAVDRVCVRACARHLQ